MVVLFFTGQVLCKHTWLVETGHGTVRPRLSGPRLSGSLAIRKKIAGYRCAAYVMHTT